MATKTDYSVQLQGAQGVASADPSSAIRATQMMGAAAGQAIQAVGSTIFEAYQGYQEEGVRQTQQGLFDSLKGEFDSLKEAEIANNASFEQSTKDAPALAAFKKEQERIGQAALQMPEKASEWRMRSSKALREAIARNPGMANSFRQVTQQITGLKDLDMYSVTNLYDEIDSIAKRQEVAQKAQAKAYEDGLKRFTNDTKNVMSETQAAAAYASMSDQERLQVASDAFKTEQRMKAFEKSLEAGGTQVANGVTYLIAGADTGNVSIMNAARQQLKEIGVDETLLTTGQLTEEMKANPKLKEILTSMSSVHRAYIDNAFQKGTQQITASMQNGAVDPTAARQALKDLQSWHQERITEIDKSGAMKVLGALVGSDEADPQKTLDTRLRTVNLLMSSFNIPPDVANLIMSGGDPKRIEKMKSDNPVAANALSHLQELRTAALRGVSNAEWFEVVKRGGELRSGSTIPIPRTKADVTATVVETEDALKKMKDGAIEGVADAPSTLKVVSSAMSIRENAENLMRQYSTALDKQLSMLPPSEKGAFMEQVKGAYENTVYGAVGHGDTAFARLQGFSPGQVFRAGAATMEFGFVDPTGAAPLKMSTKAVVKPGASEMDKTLIERYNLQPQAPKDANNSLASVDSAIRVYARVTGQDVRVLRKEFMENFLKGKPSETYTAAASGAAIAASTPKGGATQPAPSPAPVGPLKTEKQMAGAMQSGVADLQQVLQGLRSTLADTKEGSATYKRIQSDIQAAETELKRIGGK